MKQKYNLICCYVVFGSFLQLFLAKTQASDENFVTSYTTVGASVISQFVGINGHFPRFADKKGEFFSLRKDEESEKDRLFDLDRKAKPSPLTWNLGFAYTNLRSQAKGVDPSISEGILSGQLGIGWKIATEWQASLMIGLDGNSFESYSHGYANFRFEYFIPLNSQSRSIAEEKVPSPDDASQFFKAEREKKMKSLEKQWRLESLDSDEQEMNEKKQLNTYPQLRIAYNFAFNSHSVDAKTARVPSKRSTVPTEAMKMFQSQYGPELIYSPKLGHSYKIAVSYFNYNNDVDTFAALLDIGNSARYPIFPNNGVSVLSNQLFSFPSWFFGASGNWRLSSKSYFELNFGFNTYSARNQFATYAINPVYIHNFKRKFQLLLGVGVVKGSDASLVSGVVGLNFKL